MGFVERGLHVGNRREDADPGEAEAANTNYAGA